MFRRAILTLISIVSTQAAAGPFDYLPSTNGAEKEFQTLMNSGNFRQALIAWNSAHGQSEFGRSANGQATFSYLIYQSGMPFMGLTRLVERTQPSSLNRSLLNLWTQELRVSPFIQKGWIATTGRWKGIVNNDPVRLKLKNAADVNKAFAAARQLRKDELSQKTRILWSIATQAPLIGQTDAALKALKLIQESGQTILGKDLVTSVYARVLFQKGEIDAALAAYQQIPKSSNLWIESVEERAWAHLRRDDFDKAVSESVTLLSPALAPLVGPESYFLANLTALKICDYTRIFKNSELFKKRHRNRLSDMQELAKSGTNKHLPPLLERLDQKGVSLDGAGALIEGLPRAAINDSRFIRFIESRRQLNAESQRADEFASVSLGGSAEFESLKAQAKPVADKLKQSAISRLRTLAQDEVQEYKKILNRLHIVEAEVIHRLHADDNLKGERSKLSKNDESGPDVLVFPFTNDEVWFDELDNYKARVKDCPTLKGASL